MTGFGYNVLGFGGGKAPRPPYSASYLVIAGGGPGWYSGQGQKSGGGGAGGYRSAYPSDSVSGGGGSIEAQKTLNEGTTYTITVGSGGQDSQFDGSDITNVDTMRGGKGAGPYDPSTVGGSGGGGNDQGRAPSAGTANEGYSGGQYGGGGAGEVGDTDGTGYGGDGVSSQITGSGVF